MNKEIICPICKSIKSKFFCEKNKYKLYECLDCSLIFVWPIPQSLDEIYDKKYYKNDTEAKNFGYTDYDKDKESMQSVFEYYLNKFENFSINKNIFDFGGATGYFLDIAKKLGWSTSGFEISEYASNISQSKGHRMFHGDFFDHNFEKNFDVVTMWDVLEHLDKPIDYLKKINSILTDNGIIAINTIDRKSLWAKFLGKNWNMIIPPEHIFYYSQENLNIILKNTGFRIIEQGRVSKKFSLTYIFKILYNWQNIIIWDKLSKFFDNEFWRKIQVPINLRDNIFIIAKKIKDV